VSHSAGVTLLWRSAYGSSAGNQGLMGQLLKLPESEPWLPAVHGEKGEPSASLPHCPPGLLAALGRSIAAGGTEGALPQGLLPETS
jgi:hypothetical protein